MKTVIYNKIEKLLYSSEKFKIQLGLERIFNILKILGNPQEKIKVIHIAGTNGKGSVSTMTAQILNCAGYKTALYTSPHLSKYNERFKINGQDISDEKLYEYIFEIDNTAKKNNIDLSEFELLTATAYKYFYDSKVDFAVMETGLGGRYDAVNVVKQPIITAITSISIDHKDRLGDTIEKISFEKAGIIKSNVPIIVNANNRGLKVFEEIAKQKNAPLFCANKEVNITFENGINYALFDNEKYEFNLWGLHQKQNLSLVLQIIDTLVDNGIKICQKDIIKALKTVYIPARFEYNREKSRIIDGCHNADAAVMLRKNLDFYFPNKDRCWLYGTLSTKEYDKIVNILFNDGDTIYLTDFSNSLSVNPYEIRNKIKKSSKKDIQILSKTENTLNYFSKNSITIITGSFYMIG